MTHAPRKQSESGFHHVVTKGNGGQIVFENDAWRRYYLELLKTAIIDHGVEIHAYCLMDNHVHLIVKDTHNTLSLFMKQITERYANRLAKESGYIGHVFQSRFWSEPIESDEYFLSALRYVHANPEAAGICRAKDYPWSSYNSYVNAPAFVTTGFALELLGGISSFEQFHLNGNLQAKPFPTSSLHKHLTSDELVNIAASLLGNNTIHEMKSMKPVQRLPYLVKLKNAGFSESEIARLTGIGRTTIHCALN